MTKKIRGKKETVYAFGYGLASKVITYILLLVFANFYVPEEYGLSSFVLNIRNIVMLMALIGLVDGLVPYIVKKKRISSVFYTLLTMTLAFTLIGLVIMIKYSWIWPLVVTLPFVLLNSMGVAFWRAKSRFDFPNKIGLYSILVTLVFAYLLKDLGKLGIVGSYSIGYIFSFFLVVYPIRKEMINSLKGPWKWKESKQYLKTGIVVTYMASFFLLITWINSTLLGLFGMWEEVAQFTISSMLAGVITIIPLTLSMFMITRASQIKSAQKSAKVLHRVMRVSFFVSLLTSILLVVFLPLIIKIFFPLYVGIEIFVVVFLVGMLFFSSYYLIYAYYIGRLNSQKAFFPLSFGLIINIVLALILIPIYGVLGVAIASSAAHLAILIWIGRKEKMGRITIMALFAIAIISLVYFINYWGLLVFVLVIPLSIILKIITKEDIKVIKDTISGILHVT